MWALGQICILSAGPSGAVDRCARAIACSAMHPCRVMQSLRAPGGVPVLRIMLQVQMVTPHLVHVLSQSPGTVPMRQRGDRYVWSIFLRESAKINQFQPNVDAAVAHRVQRQQQYALRNGSCPASTPVRRAARSLIAASANSQLHTRSGYCSLVSEHSSPQQRDAVEASESQQSSCCQRPSTSNADESRKSEHDTRRVLSSAPIVSSAARASDALRERQVFPQNMQSITRPPLRRERSRAKTQRRPLGSPAWEMAI